MADDKKPPNNNFFGMIIIILVLNTVGFLYHSNKQTRAMRATPSKSEIICPIAWRNEAPPSRSSGKTETVAM